jgi:hypothetical protein
MKNENEARTWLLKAKAVPVTTPEDRQVQNDIEKLAANVA